MRDEPPPEPDRVPGARHPRETRDLVGHDAAERAFLDAWRGGRLHHAWLLRGPRGVGKATFAYRAARALLAFEGGGLFGAVAPDTLAVDPAHPVARRVAAGSEPRLRALRRTFDPGAGKWRVSITVDDVRDLRRFFALMAPDGGWRAVVVDAADDLNPSAANALLKTLEEPPPRSLMLLVAQAPGRLLPTIRSRCRALDLAPLGPDLLARALAAAAPDGGEPVAAAQAGALAALAGGAPGEALRLAAGDGAGLFARLVALAAGAPGFDRSALIALADACAGRDGAARFDLTLSLTVALLRRLARAGVVGAGAEAAPGEAALAGRLSPDAARARLWAETAAEIDEAGARARAVNLDPAQTILDIWLRIDAAAARALGRRP